MHGNPNPSPETRFQPGESGNPGGKTSEQRKLEIENAERATRIAGKLLVALDDAMADGAQLNLIGPAVLKLIKDSQDRGLGTPKQSILHGNDPDNPMPQPINMLMTAKEAQEAYAATLNSGKS
jgi:hypothetical protein